MEVHLTMPLAARSAHYPLARTETDAAPTGTLRTRRHQKFVAVFQPRSGFPTRQQYRLSATLRDFHEAAEGTRQRPRNGSCTEEIAGLEIATIAGVVRHQLR